MKTNIEQIVTRYALIECNMRNRNDNYNLMLAQVRLQARHIELTDDTIENNPLFAEKMNQLNKIYERKRK